MKIGQIVMILRSTLVLLTSLMALNLSLEGVKAASHEEIRAEGRRHSLLLAQTTAPSSPYPVDPSNVTNTGNAVPNVAAPGVSNTPVTPSGNVGETVNPVQVRGLQQQLQQRGYYDGPVDGVYGTSTQEAVQNFQQDAGFTSTGQVDPATNQRLNTPDLGGAGQSSGGTGGQQTAPVGQQPQPTAQSPTPANGTPNNSQPEQPASASDETPAEGGSSPETAERETNVEDRSSGIDEGAQNSGGLGRLIWPGLALVAALGSFGIGFLLANRGKDDAQTSETAGGDWGAVSPDLNVPQNHNLPKPSSDQATPVSASVESSPQVQNGRTSTPEAVAPGAQAEISEPKASMPMSETTKLAKVNIMDELMGDLQVPDPQKRRRAIWELGQRGNSSAVQPLVNAMVDADSKEKSLILAALSEIGIRSLKPMNRALAIALQDDNPDVRKNAIRDLTRIYDLVAQISQMLGHAREDEDPEVRQTAAWALEQLNRIRQVPGSNNVTSLEASRKRPDLLSGDRAK